MNDHNLRGTCTEGWRGGWGGRLGSKGRTEGVLLIFSLCCLFQRELWIQRQICDLMFMSSCSMTRFIVLKAELKSMNKMGRMCLWTLDSSVCDELLS